MNNSIVILIILIPIAIIFLIVTIVLLISYYKNSKITKKTKYINKNIDPEKLERMNIILKEVKMIASKKNKWKLIESDLIEIYNNIDDIIENIKKVFNPLLEKKNKISYKKFMHTYFLIKKEIKKIHLYENNFDIKSNEFTKQKENLNKKYVFYRKQLRESQSIFRENMLQLNNIVTSIQKFSNKIKKHDTNYHKFLEELNTFEASNELSLYIEYVKNFVLIISEIEKIETHLFITIKKYIQKLVDNFKLKKDELKTSFNHIDFYDNIKKIHKVYLEATSDYKKLNFSETKTKIKQIYKAIKSIENLINYEIICRNAFIDKKDLIMEETKKVFVQYKAVNLKIIKLVEEGKKFTPLIAQNIMQLKNQANKVKDSAKSFENSIKNKTIPYSSKLERSKDLLNNTNILIELMNKTLEDIWSLDVELTIIKNKFKKSEAAINEINFNINTYDIYLTQKVQKQKIKVENFILDISKKIHNNQINNELKEQLKLLTSNIVSLYSVVTGDIQLAEITKNLIIHLAPKRFLNNELHLNLNKIENLYLEGKYAISLNLIIEELDRIN